MSGISVQSQAVIRTLVCRQVHFRTDWYRHWDKVLGFSAGKYSIVPKGIFLHRKFWEWAAIAQALEERGMLGEGRSGLGFAVGTEPLSSLFAARGVDVIATDLAADDPGAKDWSVSNQHAAELNNLHYSHLVENAVFRKRVTFRPADMRRLAGLPKGQFDFVWSSCALEHLGSLKNGLRFIHESTDLLKPGGVGIHTTEFNLSSADKTLEHPSNVIYLRKHIENLDVELRKKGRCLAEPDYFPGDDEHDRVFDIPPYYTHGRQHIKLKLNEYITTSIVLVVLA
jgi:hypothetical protein